MVCAMRTRSVGAYLFWTASLASMTLSIGKGFAAIAGTADASGNPYQVISHKNLFRLHPPIVNTKPSAPATPAATIILTGITTVLGEKRAFLEITPPPKPPKPVKLQSCILAEGEKQGEVEVLEIDPKAGAVKVSNGGSLTNLTFEKNGPKLARLPSPTIPSRTLPQFPTLRAPIRYQRR